MKRLSNLWKFITGTVTGSCIAVFNPSLPVSLTGDSYTLEELAYQDTRHEERTAETGWSYQWVPEEGLVLLSNRKTPEGRQTVGLRRAVFRTVVGKRTADPR